MGLGYAQLPREAGALDAGPAGGTGAAVVAGDGDVLGLALGDARGDDPDPDLRDELDRNAGRRVRALEVVDELGQVLDGVDVVVRGRGDEAHAGHAVARRRDVLGDLVAGQLATYCGEN